MRKGGGISIWFFVGISLLVNGALILGAGLWELVISAGESGGVVPPPRQCVVGSGAAVAGDLVQPEVLAKARCRSGRRSLSAGVILRNRRSV